MNGNSPKPKRGVLVLHRGRNRKGRHYGNHTNRQARQPRPSSAMASQNPRRPQIVSQGSPTSNLNPNAREFVYHPPAINTDSLPTQSMEVTSSPRRSPRHPLIQSRRLEIIQEEDEEPEPWATDCDKFSDEEGERPSNERDEKTGKLLNSRRVYNITLLLSSQCNALCSSPPSDFSLNSILADYSLVDRAIKAMNDEIELRQPRQTSHGPSRPRFRRASMPSKPRRTLSNGRRRLPQLEKDKLMSKTRLILNKITPDKFDLLAKRLTQLLDEQVSCLEQLEVVVDAILCVGIDQPGFAVQYASLLNYLSQQRRVVTSWDWVYRSGENPRTLVKKTVRKLCLAKHAIYWYETTPCHEDFLLDVANYDEVVLSHEMCCTIGMYAYDDGHLDKAKVKLIGLAVMVGQLCNQRIVSKEMVCVEMINPLLRLRNDRQRETEAWRGEVTAMELEAVCKLLTICGQQLDGKGRAWLDMYCRVLTENTACLGARMRFMVRDLVDLRAAGWDRPRKQCSPVTKPRPSNSKVARASIRGKRRGGVSRRGRFSPSTTFHRVKKY